MGIVSVVPGRTASGGASGMSGSTLMLILGDPLPIIASIQWVVVW
jgi:hypothetical protein